MSQATTAHPTSDPGHVGYRHAPVTIDEYNRMIDVGAFSDRRCELLEGEIVETASTGNAHAVSLQDLYDELRVRFPKPWFIKNQSTQRTGELFAPDPDLALLAKYPSVGARLDEPALLIVEISDSTLRKDLTVKKLAYARYGIRELWVVNLHRKIVHVFRGPNADARHHDPAYASEQQIGLDGVVAPLVDETKTIRVADFMPTAGAEPDETA